MTIRATFELEPAGLLPGPLFGARPDVAVGVIVKPSLGLSPAQVAGVVATAVAAGATFVKDDETLGDPGLCPFEGRVGAVADVLLPGVTYCANVTGPAATLVDRARRAVELGATGVPVNGVAQGLASVFALRDADLGVPILVHRTGHLMVGAFGGKLFVTDEDVAAGIRAAREPLGPAPAPWVVIGGGIGPDNAPVQAARAGEGTVLLLGLAAYRAAGGIGASVEAVVEALSGRAAPARPA